MSIVVTGIIVVFAILFIIRWLYNNTSKYDNKDIYTSNSKSGSRRSSSSYISIGGYYGSNASGSYSCDSGGCGC